MGPRLMRFTAYPALALLLSVASVAYAQAPSGPPSVGIVRAQQTSITETSEFVGRVQAIERVALTARVTAFLDQRLFKEGTEVNQGDLLYKLERAPFEAAVQQQEAAVADTTPARLANANIQLTRAQSLLNTPAGQRSNVDDAVANQRSLAAQVLSAQAQLKAAQINLDYTDIHAPVAGKISRTAITAGNVVSPPSSGPLASIVSQDPMYVLFPVASAHPELNWRSAMPTRAAPMQSWSNYACLMGLSTVRKARSTMSSRLFPRRRTLSCYAPALPTRLGFSQIRVNR